MTQFNTVFIRYEAHLWVCDNKQLPCRPKWKIITFQMKSCTICSHAFYALSRKTPLEHLFITDMMGSGNKIDCSAGKMEIRSVYQVYQFKGFHHTWPEERPLSLKLTSKLIPFVTYQKCCETSLPAAYLHLKKYPIHLDQWVAILGRRRVKTNVWGVSVFKWVTWRNYPDRSARYTCTTSAI